MEAKACPMCGGQAQQLGESSFCLDCDWDDLPVIAGEGIDRIQAAIDDLVQNDCLLESSIPDLKRLLPENEYLALDMIRHIRALPANIHTVRYPEWIYVDGTLCVKEHKLRIREVSNE